MFPDAAAALRGKKSLGTVFKKMYGRLKTKSHKSASHVCEGSSVHGNRKSNGSRWPRPAGCEQTN